MNTVKVASVALNQTPLDWENNTARIIKALNVAKEDSARLICFPELAITGYGCEDYFLAPDTCARAWNALNEIISHTANVLVAIGLPVSHHGRIYNAVALLCDKEVLGIVAKRNLAGDGIHYEPRWFTPCPSGSQTQFKNKIPFGDISFDVGGILVGIEICEDSWVGNRPAVNLSRIGVDIILNPSASHFALGKRVIRRRMALEASRAFHCSVVFSNLLGCESGRTIFDGDSRIATVGTLCAEATPFSFNEYTVTTALLDIEHTRIGRAASFEGKTKGNIFNNDQLVYTPFSLWDENQCYKNTLTDCTECYFKEDEFSDFSSAVALGLFDYIRKSRSRGVVLSLSGGADSTAVALLCYLMVQLGTQSIGLETLCRTLGVPVVESIKQFMADFLTCVYQETKNSSSETRASAKLVAASLGAAFHVWNIDELVEKYELLVTESLGYPLQWETHDLPLQNIQPRVRVPGVWMLANVKNAILLTTGNRSEGATGYCTMDGDTSGGLNPIAGVSKHFLKTWLEWYSEKEQFQFLKSVTSLAPSAELRPLSTAQQDEKDLMPYNVLAAIETLAIENKKTPIQVFTFIEGMCGQIYSRTELHRWVKKFFQSWARSQWKRERLAVGFHTDKFSIDPRGWMRFPVLSGGFSEELRALDQYVLEDEQ